MRDIATERQDIDAAVAGWTLPKAFAAAAGRFPDVRRSSGAAATAAGRA